MTGLPTFSETGDSAWSSAVRTVIGPPSAAMPAGALTRIISSLTSSKPDLATVTPPGNTTSVTSEKPEPLMVIGWPATTLVGKNTLMCSPRSADSLPPSLLQDARAPTRTIDRINPKYLNIFFIS